MRQFIRQIAQQIFLRLFGGEAGDTLQHFELPFFQILHILQTGFHILLLGEDRLFLLLAIFNLAVESFLLLLNTPFLTLYVHAPFLEFLFRVIAQAMDLILCFNQQVLFFRFCRGFRITHNSLGFRFCGTDRSFSCFFSMRNARFKGDKPSHNAADR